MLIKELLSLNEESNEYEDSAEFTDEFYGIYHKLKEIKDIIDSKKWKNWMSITETNFSVDVIENSEKLSKTINEAIDIFDDLDGEMEKF